MKCEICGFEIECPKVEQHSSVKKPCKVELGAVWAHVVDDEWKNIKDIPVSLSGKFGGQPEKTTEVGFAKFFPLDMGEYTVGPVLDEALLKKYDPPEPKSRDVLLMFGDDIKYAAFVLFRKAKVTLQVIKKGDKDKTEGKKVFNDADVTLEYKEGAKDKPKKKTAGEGKATFEERSAGQYEVTGVLGAEDKKRYVEPEAPLAFALQPGEDKAVVYEVIPLATPTIKVIEQGSKREVEGITVKLTAKKGAKEHSLDKTRKSGLTDLTKDQTGLVPGDYTVAVAADDYKPVLVTPNEVTFAEGDKKTVVVEVTLPKGAIRVLVNRYDGKSLKARVKFKVAKTSDLSNPVATPETAEREVEVEREYGRKVKVKEDWKDAGDLDPGDYQIEIVDLADKVLKNQEASQEWRVGPNKDGKIKVKVEAGKTAEVRFTVSRYKKVRFIGYNVKPGYIEGLRCLKCSAQNPTTAANCGTCGYVLYKRCFQCKNYFPAASTTDCPTCAVLANVTSGPHYWCTTCGTWSSPPCFAPPPPPHVVDMTPRFVHTCWKNTSHKHVDTVNAPTPCTTGCKLALTLDQQYMGLSNNQEDLLARCLLMKAAIQEAHTKEADDNPEELKVFMGPEFYFRGVDGAYPVDDLHLILDTLREETKDAKYKDWLFVYGTAIGKLAEAPSDDTRYSLKVSKAAVGATVIEVTSSGDKVGVCDKIPAENGQLPLAAQWRVALSGKTTAEKVVQAVTKVDANTYQITLPGAVSVDVDNACTLIEPLSAEILNYALVQRGGPDAVAGLREGLVYKEKISHIDFLRITTNTWSSPGSRNIFLGDKDVIALPTEGADETLGRKKNPVSGEVTSTGLGGGSIFTMDGITFGLEVCLDHLSGRMAKYFTAPPAGAAKVQVHLIPSWGAWITPKNFCGTAGTLVFNVDGPDGSDACKLTGAPPGTEDKLPSAKATRLTTPVSHLVPQPAKENVTFKDSSQRPPQDKTVNDLDPKYNLLIPKHKHQVNRGGPGAEDYAWVDLYAAEDLPLAETY